MCISTAELSTGAYKEYVYLHVLSSISWHIQHVKTEILYQQSMYVHATGLILGLHRAIKKRRYKVT